jgi:3-deoxy-7-phosphoheptulonate synthase
MSQPGIDFTTASHDAEPIRVLAHAPAEQQPDWADEVGLARTRRRLSRRPAMVGQHDVDTLAALLADVADGSRLLLQIGDCVEDPRYCADVADVRAKVAMLDELAGCLEQQAGRPVVRVGRMAGVFAKPRSAAFESVDGFELPAYRGPMVNAPEPAPAARRADPHRLLLGHELSRAVHCNLQQLGVSRRPAAERVWTSHETLLLDYELPLVRRMPDGRWLLTSTHFPWIGDRTRQLDGFHVRLLAMVANPVACKVGPASTPEQVLRLCAALDPDRRPGRLTLVARLGAGRCGEHLPALVDAVRRAGHPVVWLCDPVHANTRRSPAGRKTRALPDICQEVREFQEAVAEARGVVGGLHLETTPHPVGECVEYRGGEPAGPFTTLCDPRLNPEQARAVLSHWFS